MQPVHLEMSYMPDSERAEPFSVDSGTINLSIAKIDILDDRVDQEHIGASDAPIYGTGIIEWIRSGIESLARPGYSFPSSNEERNSSGLTLQVNIKRVSSQGTVMHMRCSTLIDVGFFYDDVLIRQESYYGVQVEEKGLFSQGTRHFGEKAVLGCLNGSLDQLLAKFETDLRQLNAEISAQKSDV